MVMKIKGQLNKTIKNSNFLQSNMKNKKDYPEMLFIPGGVCIGIGVGFLINQVAAGVLLGIGTGFVLAAITRLIKNR